MQENLTRMIVTVVGDWEEKKIKLNIHYANKNIKCWCSYQNESSQYFSSKITYLFVQST